jgi:hypothetical protein
MRSFDADHVSEDGVLLGAEDLVDLGVDDGQVVGDLLHRLLDGELGHDPGGAGEDRRVGQHGADRSRLHDLEELRDLAVLGEHGAVHPRAGPRHELRLLQRCSRLLRELHPPPGLLRDRGGSPRGPRSGVQHGAETRPVQRLRRKPLGREEALDCARIADDRDAVAVVDEMDLDAHRALPWHVRSPAGSPPASRRSVPRRSDTRGTNGGAVLPADSSGRRWLPTPVARPYSRRSPGGMTDGAGGCRRRRSRGYPRLRAQPPRTPGL